LHTIGAALAVASFAKWMTLPEILLAGGVPHNDANFGIETLANANRLRHTGKQITTGPALAATREGRRGDR